MTGTGREVVLVHGLWFPAAGLRVLARRLERDGFAVRLFGYRTTRDPLGRGAEALARLLESEYARGADLLGHSLGGLLIIDALAASDWSAPGRLLFLGTPLQGSAVVRRVAGWPGVRRMIGHARERLRRGGGAWPYGRDCGMIAGDRAAGLGLLSGALQGPSDGTVAVAETRAPELRDHLVLPVSHTGMVFSGPVARQAAHFLRRGRFDRGTPA